MASFPNASDRAYWGHGETAWLFLLAVIVAMFLECQSVEKPEPQRYAVVCGLRC